MDLDRSFGTKHFAEIWTVLEQHLDVLSVSVAGVTAYYHYHWQDHNYMQQQIEALGGK